jgi:hypothetical protein
MDLYFLESGPNPLIWGYPGNNPFIAGHGGMSSVGAWRNDQPEIFFLYFGPFKKNREMNPAETYFQV